MKRSAPAKDVDAYLAAVPAKPRAALQKLRKIIQGAAPSAVEVISYRVPIFKHRGPLVGFAAFPDHCSFFVMSPPLMKARQRELASYDTSPGTIRFPHDKPLPASLVRALVRARIRENESRATKTQSKKQKKPARKDESR